MTHVTAYDPFPSGGTDSWTVEFNGRSITVESWNLGDQGGMEFTEDDNDVSATLTAEESDEIHNAIEAFEGAITDPWRELVTPAINQAINTALEAVKP